MIWYGMIKNHPTPGHGLSWCTITMVYHLHDFSSFSYSTFKIRWPHTVCTSYSNDGDPGSSMKKTKVVEGVNNVKLCSLWKQCYLTYLKKKNNTNKLFVLSYCSHFKSSWGVLLRSHSERRQMWRYQFLKCK